MFYEYIFCVLLVAAETAAIIIFLPKAFYDSHKTLPLIPRPVPAKRGHAADARDVLERSILDRMDRKDVPFR